VIFSGDTLVCRGSNLVLSASQPGATYLWQDGSTAATFQVVQEGDYRVTVRQGGCTTTSIMRVVYQDCEPFIPNIITPNADASNETFFIRNINPREWALEIYNRWGARVYQVSQYGNDWAAKELPDGVYYYKLSQPGLQRSYKGYLEVLR
jgi:gliding motility-associated-like protein